MNWRKGRISLHRSSFIVPGLTGAADEGEKNADDFLDFLDVVVGQTNIFSTWAYDSIQFLPDNVKAASARRFSPSNQCNRTLCSGGI
jgi:hypothetical protein